MLDENGFTFKKTILAVGRSDLRKGIDGLAAMVKLKYGLIMGWGQVHSSVYPAGGWMFPVAKDSAGSQEHYHGGI